MTKLQYFCVCLYVGNQPEKNVWPPRNESGIDVRRMPNLAGSGLEKFFLPPRGPKPIDTDRPAESIWEFLLVCILVRVIIIMTIIPGLNLIILYALAAHGEVVLEEVPEEDAKTIPPYSWEEMVELIQNSDWEHP